MAAKKLISIRIELDYVAAERLDKFCRTKAGKVSRRSCATKMIYEALSLRR